MAKRVQLMSTAYGAPWGGIQGTGVTSTGIDLRAHPKQYVVAVDPRVIPLGSKLKIAHNPFGDPNIVFTAADTGGAIKGNRLDFYDWRGRKAQMGWGTRPIEAQIVGHGAPHDTQRAGGGGGTSGTPGTPGTYDPGAPTSDLTSSSSGADLASLVQQLMQPQQQSAPSAGLPDPSFSARSALRMPTAYQPISSSGGPAPRPDMSSVIQSILPALQGSAMPADAVPRGTPGTPGTAAAGAPRHRTEAVRSLFERAQSIDAEHLPYKWGGGHGPTPAKPGVPVDCSGAVSRLLGVNPRVSGQFEAFGRPGRGKSVTIYANQHHVLMEINGHFWGTSATNPGGGAGWIPRSAISPQYLTNFTARHPPGL